MYDEKIISRVINNFETALPNSNKFIIIIARNAKPKYVLDNKPYIVKTNYGSHEFWNAVGDVSNYKNIIIHNLGTPSVRFISKINHPRITWLSWGADLYGGFLTPKGFIAAYDESLVRSFSKSKQIFPLRIINHFSKRYYYKKRIDAIKKISSVSLMNEEFGLLKKYYPEANHLKQFSFFYYAVDDLIKPAYLDCMCDGDDIMVGHSASLNGNHMEVFNLLSSLNLQGRNLLVPLSYGNMAYKEYLIDNGKRLFGESFVPITEFLPLEKYIETMRSARTYIYGQYRQEAWGNIVMALCWGAAIFFHPSNPLCSYLKELGCTVFSTKELPKKLHYIMTDEEKTKNKSIMLKTFSKDRLFENICNYFG